MLCSASQPALPLGDHQLWPTAPPLSNPIPTEPRSCLATTPPQGGRCIWKTTTYGQLHHVGRDRDLASIAAARRHGWQLMDAWAATRAAKLQLPDDPFIDTVRRESSEWLVLCWILPWRRGRPGLVMVRWPCALA